jgi:hypothetical protein
MKRLPTNSIINMKNFLDIPPFRNSVMVVEFSHGTKEKGSVFRCDQVMLAPGACGQVKSGRELSRIIPVPVEQAE